MAKPMVLVQKCYFSNFFFLGNIGKECVFYDILVRKNNFLGYKIDIVPKGLTHPFGPKIAIFLTFIF